MPRILHMADVHFDTPFSARFDERQARMRRNEMKNEFSALIRHAAAADLLLIAGDLFDSSYVREETLAFVRRKFDEIPQTEIFITAGNHDPLSSGVYASLENVHVHVFPKELAYFDLPELETRVHGISFQEPHMETLGFTSLDLHPDWCNLLVLHGDITGGESMYRPIRMQELAALGADYIALGHIHKYSGVQRAGGSFYAYPGVWKGRGFDECGDSGVLAGMVSKGLAELSFQPTAGKRFFHLEVSCQPEQSVQELVEQIAEQALSMGGETDFYRVRLSGKRGANLWNRELWVQEIEDLLLQVQKHFAYLEIEDDTAVEIPESLIAANPLVRTFAECFEEPPEGEEELYAMAREIGLEALIEKA